MTKRRAIERPVEERESLIRRFMPLCARLASKWGFSPEQREELRSEFFLNLVDVVDHTPTASLVDGYVATSMRYCRISLFQRTVAGSRIPPAQLVSLESPLPGEGLKRNPQTLHDVITDPDVLDPEQQAAIAQADSLSRQIVAAALSQLSPIQRKILCTYIGFDDDAPQPMTVIAESLGIGLVSCWNHLKQAKTILHPSLQPLVPVSTPRPLTLTDRDKILAKLSPVQQTIVARHYGLGPDSPVPVSTIARDLDRSPGNSHKQYAAAKVILRQELHKRGYGHVSGDDLRDILTAAARRSQQDSCLDAIAKQSANGPRKFVQASISMLPAIVRASADGSPGARALAEAWRFSLPIKTLAAEEFDELARHAFYTTPIA